jgi:apolipoprotein N-acyltransferase
MARLRLWLVMFPLLAAGTQGAAALVDMFAPKSYETAELFSRSNASHSILPVIAGLGGAALLCAVCSFATTAPTSRRVPRWTFACLPPLLFTLQEYGEYVVGHGTVPWTLVGNPVFLSGLLLQIPFALAAWLLARLLIDVVAAIAERSSGRRTAPRRGSPPCVRAGAEALLRPRLLWGRRLTRGPPAPAAV